MTAKNAHQELWELTAALRSHLQWHGECGATGVPPHTAESIEARRQEYRNFPFGAADWDAFELESRAPAPPTPTAPRVQAPASADLDLTKNKPTIEAAAFPTTTPRPPAAAPESPTGGLRPVAHRVPQVATSPEVTLQPKADRPSEDGGSAPPELAPVQPRSKGTPMDEQSKEKLRVLQLQVEGCSKCELSQARQNTVFARGNGLSGLCIVGEGPGADEDAQGLPFVGKAGQLLDKMVAAMGLDREEVYVCNIVKCRPPGNRKPDLREMHACRGYLQEQLQLLAPRVIVALGATAVTGLLDLNIGITRLRGQWRLYQGKIPVMPTFHPAYLLRQPSAKRQVWEDLQEVMRVLQEQH